MEISLTQQCEIEDFIRLARVYLAFCQTNFTLLQHLIVVFLIENQSPLRSGPPFDRTFRG